MKQCPWYGNYGHTVCGSPANNGNCIAQNALWMCHGQQKNHRTFRDCPYYTNKRDYVSFTGRKCPQCVVTKGHNRYSATCISPKNQNANGKICMSYGICAEGRTEKGKKYTNCPYYTRKTTAEARQKGAGAKAKPYKPERGISPVTIFVIAVILITLYGYAMGYGR